MLIRLTRIALVISVFAAGWAGAELSGAQESEDPAPPAISPYEPEIDPEDFVNEVDNPYFPLDPGTTYIYEGAADGESEVDTVEVTRKTKEILGIETTVVRDVVTVDGEVTEETFDWYAQDRWGNVWYFGEDTKEFEDGQISTAGSWEAGVDGALPGIIMLGDPDVRERYRQEFYAGEAEDMAQVLQLDASVTVPYGTFDDVLVTKDWTPLDRKVLENKYYAPGVGLVQERTVKGGTGEFHLVEVK